MKTKSENRWVIVGKHGCYTGQCLTRGAMIAEHVSAFAGCESFPAKISPYASGRGLNPDQKASWNICRKRGDRAVRATITWKQP